MGRVTIMGSSSKAQEPGVQALPLMGEGKEAATYKPGKLYVKLTNFQDIDQA